MSESPFEVVGAVPDPWLDDLARVASQLAAHPWGGASLELVLYGDLPELLREHMSPARFSEWMSGYEAGRIAVTGAISFVAIDGRRAAAVPAVDDRDVFLMLAGHEMVEASLERRHDEEGHVFEDGTHTSLAHVLWIEYVVERTRREVFDALGLGYGALDNGFVSDQIVEIDKELPELIRWAVANNDVPQRIIQHWYELARIYSMSLGRADQGSPQDIQDLDAFRRHPLIRESAAEWAALGESLRRVFEQPRAPADTLDQLVRNEGWMPLYEDGLGGFWNHRYAAAGGT